MPKMPLKRLRTFIASLADGDIIVEDDCADHLNGFYQNAPPVRKKTLPSSPFLSKTIDKRVFLWYTIRKRDEKEEYVFFGLQREGGR